MANDQDKMGGSKQPGQANVTQDKNKDKQSDAGRKGGQASGGGAGQRDQGGGAGRGNNPGGSRTP